MIDSQLVVGDMIYSPSSNYKIQAVLGSGSFGVVAQCINLDTNQTVAIKVLKDKRQVVKAKEETDILKMLKELDCGKFNIVTLNETFTFWGRFCLEFEKLDINLRQFLQKRCFEPLSLMEIRPIIQQLAIGLNFLKNAGIVHADLKPENIMMVDHEGQPLRLKIIDFGLALNNPEQYTGVTVGTRWYRAPEVILGHPISEAIDVWSLGCIAAEMLMNTFLFPGCDDYDMIRHIVYTIGPVPDHMVAASLYGQKYFTLSYSALGCHTLRFMSTLEARNAHLCPCTLKSLSGLMKSNVSLELSGEDCRADECDRSSFVDLVTKTLKVDGAERITPAEILQHPFITMSHLVGTFEHSCHVKSGMKLMSAFKPPSPQSSINSNSQSAKRKRGAEEDTECGNRSPDTTPVKKARTESEEAAKPGNTSPQKSRLQKRKRDDDDQTSDGSPALKKMPTVNFVQKLMEGVYKLLSRSGDTSSSPTPVDQTRKRTRADEDAAGSKEEQRPSPVKTRRIE